MNKILIVSFSAVEIDFPEYRVDNFAGNQPCPSRQNNSGRSVRVVSFKRTMQAVLNCQNDVLHILERVYHFEVAVYYFLLTVGIHGATL